MSKKEKKNKNGLLYLLLALLLFSIIYSYKKNQDHETLQAVFVEEKSDLESELNELIEDYKDLSVKKKDLSKRLIREMNKIIGLRDSVKNLKASNYKSIRKYRRKIVTLERENRDLFAKVDSLNIINTYLKKQNKETVAKLEDKNLLADKLEKTNKELKEKVAIAGVLKINDLKTIVMKERSSGKLTSTSRSSRADAFKTNFKLLKNEVAKTGQKEIYVQITDNKNNVIAPKGVATLKNKKQIEYSDKLIADYQNEEMDALSLVLVNRDNISKGKYNINVFVEGNFVGKSTVSLR